MHFNKKTQLSKKQKNWERYTMITLVKRKLEWQLILHKVNFRVKNTTKDKEDYFIINKRVSLSGGHENAHNSIV